MLTPEHKARHHIERLLVAAGWVVQDRDQASLHAARVVAIREFPLAPGHGTAVLLIYVDARARRNVEAKKVGATLTRAEVQSRRYAQGLRASLPAWRRPLPLVSESTRADAHPSPKASTPSTSAAALLPSTGPKRWRNGSAPRPYCKQADRARVHRPPGRPLPCSCRARCYPGSATCPRSSPNGAPAAAATSSGRPRSPPSATWRRV